jgi:hypothetical protein
MEGEEVWGGLAVKMPKPDVEYSAPEYIAVMSRKQDDDDPGWTMI